MVMKRLLLLLVLLPGIAFAEQISGNTSASAAVGGALPDKIVTVTATGADKTGLDINISGATSTTNATFAPLDVTAFGAIGAAYASAVDLPDGTKVVIVDNQTNGDVMVSFDGGVSDHLHVKAGDVMSYNLASSGLVTTADVQIKDGTAVSTAGSFYIYSYK
jgi:hypothetical protein